MRDISAKSLRAAVYLVFVILFVTYMLNADRVYHALSGKCQAVKLPDDFRLPALGDVKFFYIDHDFLVNSPFEEGKLFLGRSVKLANSRGKAQFRVFLRSADALYEVIQKRRSFWAKSGNHLVNFFISTSGLKDGIYQLGLFLSDDEGARFAWTASFFERVDGGPVAYVARPVAPVAAATSEALKFCIDRISKETEAILVRGWAVLENRDMNDYQAYLKVEDARGVCRTFYLPLYTRMGIAVRQHDPQAANCGFRIRISRGELAPGSQSIKVVVKHRTTGEAIESAESIIKNF